MLFNKNQVSWIVVFLGNPGAKYELTRHNAGFMTADAYARLHSLKISRLKFHALTETCTIGDEKVLLMKPQTFMNESGTAASEAMRFYKVPLEHVLVVSDDVTLPVGKLRVRRSGSAGGHNGLKDIIAKCGGDGFPRIKLGVGKLPRPDYSMIDWVLGAFHDQDLEDMLKSSERAAEAVESVIIDGVDKSMNKFNG
jgi:PTH1 family peptidyl-tRNA hydrolase